LFTISPSTKQRVVDEKLRELNVKATRAPVSR
jgi:hypothetical protein